MKELLQRLLTHEDFKQAFTSARRAQGVLNAQIQKDAEVLDLPGSIKRLAFDVETLPDEDERTKAANRLTVLKTTGEHLRGSALLTASLIVEKLEVFIREMLERAASAALSEHEKDIAAENAFFAGHGLPHEATQLSKRWVQLRSQIDAYRQSIDDHAAKLARSNPQIGMFEGSFALFEVG